MRVTLREWFTLTGYPEQWLPWIGGARRYLEIQMVIDVNQPRAPLRPFEIACRPI